MSFVGKALVGVAIVGASVWAVAVAANAQPLDVGQADVVIEQPAQPVAVSGPASGVAVDQAVASTPPVTVHPDGAHSVDDAAPTVTPAEAGAVPLDQATAAEFAAAVPVDVAFAAADGRTVTAAELSLTEEQQRALLDAVQSGSGVSTATPAP